MNADLYEAAKAGSARRLLEAVRRGVRDINAFNSKGYTCLHLVSSQGNSECASILLREGGANPNACTSPSFETPLHAAALHGFPSVVHLLLKAGANANSTDEKNATACHLAAAGGSIEILEMLVSTGADLNIPDYKQRTPADVAKQYGQPAACSFLLAQGGRHGVGARPSGEVPPPGGPAAQPKSMRPPAPPGNDLYPPTKLGPSGSEQPRPDIYGTAGWNYGEDMGAAYGGDEYQEPEEEPPKDPMETLEEELATIIGLDKVKDMLRSLCKQVAVDLKRAQYGYKPQHNVNMLFIGNPGTGKTSMARIVAKMMKELGVLKTGQLVEVSRKDLVAEFAGQSAAQTSRKIQEAVGGVLFVDEAYALKADQGHDAFGQEAVNTLVAEMENRREELVVIMAGYSKEMSSFMSTNSGLASRFQITMEFANYDWNDMQEIFRVMLHGRGLSLDESISEARLCQLLQHTIPKSAALKGNGRAVRNVLEAVLREQTNRLADSGTDTEEELMTVIEADFTNLAPEKTETELDDVLGELERVIGIAEVKDFLRRLRAQITIVQEKKAMGIPVDHGFGSLHMIFKGNPGTGKTMMARLVGRLLKALGVLSQGQLIEATRADLVGDHLGETAGKTGALVDRALGGVLFIDEAYSLINAHGKDSYGKEATDTLLKLIEDWRSELVIILAGHGDEMDSFIEKNPGFRSRFNIHVNFPDYNGGELVAIAVKMLEGMNMRMSREALAVFSEMASRSAAVEGANGNGRWVRNTIERAQLHQAERLCRNASRSRDDLVTLHAADFDHAVIGNAPSSHPAPSHPSARPDPSEPRSMAGLPGSKISSGAVPPASAPLSFADAGGVRDGPAALSHGHGASTLGDAHTIHGGMDKMHGGMDKVGSMGMDKISLGMDVKTGRDPAVGRVGDMHSLDVGSRYSKPGLNPPTKPMPTLGRDMGREPSAAAAAWSPPGSEAIRL